MVKGCGKSISNTDNLPCGSWWGGDQHFCKECFNKIYHKEDANCGGEEE